MIEIIKLDNTPMKIPLTNISHVIKEGNYTLITLVTGEKIKSATDYAEIELYNSSTGLSSITVTGTAGTGGTDGTNETDSGEGGFSSLSVKDFYFGHSRLYVYGSILYASHLNEVFESSDFKYIYLNGGSFSEPTQLEELKLDSCINLYYLYVQGVSRLTGDVPADWSKLEKLRYVYYRNVGYNTEQIDSFLNSFLLAVQNGLGSDATSKRLYVTGSAKPTFDKTLLAPYGWTVYHS